MTEHKKEMAKKVSELLKQGKSRAEICEIIKRDKGWLSKLIKQMKEEYQELLEGTAEEPEQETPNKPSNKPIRTQKEQERTETQMLSFRANTGDIRRWKAYAQAKGITSTELYTAAVNAFLEDNPLLTADETQLYELLLKRGF